MEPTAREAESKLVASLLIYAYGKVKTPIPDHVRTAAKNSYGDVANLDPHTRLLCGFCGSLSKENETKIIYDGRNATARMLAEWWDRHQKADRDRRNKKRAEKRIERTKEKALAKLTPFEKKVLGLS